jgi:hypothetical protein
MISDVAVADCRQPGDLVGQPEMDTLTAQERALITFFRRLGESDRASVLRFAEVLAGAPPG